MEGHQMSTPGPSTRREVVAAITHPPRGGQKPQSIGFGTLTTSVIESPLSSMTTT